MTCEELKWLRRRFTTSESLLKQKLWGGGRTYEWRDEDFIGGIAKEVLDESDGHSKGLTAHVVAVAVADWSVSLLS